MDPLAAGSQPRLICKDGWVEKVRKGDREALDALLVVPGVGFETVSGDVGIC
jgi:hypothetical protein